MNFMEETRAHEGKTTIAPEVLLTIARLAALGVEGVARMGAVSGGVNKLFKRGVGEGVRIEVQEGRVTADLFLVVRPESSVREVSRSVQAEVARAIEELVGM